MDEKTTFQPTSLRLMDQVRETLRFYHYAYNTEKSYVEWILRFIHFSGKRHPKDMGKPEIEKFLSHLAINRNVAAATQNQAFNAIMFLYKKSSIVPTLRVVTHSMTLRRPAINNYLDKPKLNAT